MARKRKQQQQQGQAPPPVTPATPPPPKKQNKYRAVRTLVDGILFASKKEARRYGELKLLAAAGAVRDLRLQPKYPLVVNGVKIGRYTGDFLYLDVAAGREVLEDVKSPASRTEAYALRKKLLLALYGLEITEV